MNPRWRGVKDLLQDAIEHGSRAVERVQKQAAARPFDIVARIPPLTLPTQGIHAAYDLCVSAAHGAVRGVNRVVGGALDVVFDFAEHADETAARAHEEERPSGRDQPPSSR
ncbi:hypothetical protein [Haliangium sp.]|uniref:hypothetical protein n=1 Tax=Haliangium sp. TaxID=2663208 RepID=UPI003D0CD390